MRMYRCTVPHFQGDTLVPVDGTLYAEGDRRVAAAPMYFVVEFDDQPADDDGPSEPAGGVR